VGWNEQVVELLWYCLIDLDSISQLALYMAVLTRSSPIGKSLFEAVPETKKSTLQSRIEISTNDF